MLMPKALYYEPSPLDILCKERAWSEIRSGLNCQNVLRI
jgi:hypothetical protein